MTYCKAVGHSLNYMGPGDYVGEAGCRVAFSPGAVGLKAVGHSLAYTGAGQYETYALPYVIVPPVFAGPPVLEPVSTPTPTGVVPPVFAGPPQPEPITTHEPPPDFPSHDPTEPDWPVAIATIATAHDGSGIMGRCWAEANRIDSQHYPYSWGGGHNPSFSGPYDCSGAVSAVLHAGGLLGSPLVSGEMETIGKPGPGRITIYANAKHVYMSLDGHFFGTSRSNPGRGAGWFNGAARDGFVVRHFDVTGSPIHTFTVGGPPPALGGGPSPSGPTAGWIANHIDCSAYIDDAWSKLASGTNDARIQARAMRNEALSIKHCNENGPVT
jgi:hypothetical protein